MEDKHPQAFKSQAPDRLGEPILPCGVTAHLGMSQDLALVKGCYPGDGLGGTWPDTDFVGLLMPSKDRRGAGLGQVCAGFGA